ncbi:PREDICTED: tyrosine-protein kinase Src64B-like [Priapulus caudatus]|uniref:Tyrosine-protein kinase n=1 Tax=Priapulus caudatus TaxID=37621 RepID=A0ABM1EPQ9_PRICU|nr:PREDICTED: tyrosine-protein kinase Src64B-like [Priapulus caudatus]
MPRLERSASALGDRVRNWSKTSLTRVRSFITRDADAGETAKPSSRYRPSGVKKYGGGGGGGGGDGGKPQTNATSQHPHHQHQKLRSDSGEENRHTRNPASPTPVPPMRRKRMKLLSNRDWWYAKHLVTQQDGYIPSNFVQNFDKEDWNFGHVTRKEAERLLKATGNTTGTFLIRESESAPANDVSHRCVAGTWKGVLEVAIKTLKSGTTSSSSFLQEAKIMTKTRHDKLVQLYGVCSEEDPIYIVTEYMNNGNLLHYLRQGAGREADLGMMIDIAAQTASGMAFLETENLIHRDLAARNILVGDNNTIKVADFGLARIIEEGAIYTPGHGPNGRSDLRIPIKWTAPEAAMLQKFTIKSDVWSYGILLQELFTKGQVPYPGMTNREVLEAIQRGYRMPRAADTPKEVYEIQMMCWSEDAEKRPTFEYLFVFFDDFAVNIEQSYESGDVLR